MRYGNGLWWVIMSSILDYLIISGLYHYSTSSHWMMGLYIYSRSIILEYLSWWWLLVENHLSSLSQPLTHLCSSLTTLSTTTTSADSDNTNCSSIMSLTLETYFENNIVLIWIHELFVLLEVNNEMKIYHSKEFYSYHFWTVVVTVSILMLTSVHNYSLDSTLAWSPLLTTDLEYNVFIGDIMSSKCTNHTTNS